MLIGPHIRPQKNEINHLSFTSEFEKHCPRALCKDGHLRPSNEATPAVAPLSEQSSSKALLRLLRARKPPGPLVKMQTDLGSPRWGPRLSISHQVEWVLLVWGPDLRNKFLMAHHTGADKAGSRNSTGQSQPEPSKGPENRLSPRDWL